eukprot:scaffold1437_cov113-Cylindrotheca_fusiformis.AAC.5
MGLASISPSGFSFYGDEVLVKAAGDGHQPDISSVRESATRRRDYMWLRVALRRMSSTDSKRSRSCDSLSRDFESGTKVHQANTTNTCLRCPTITYISSFLPLPFQSYSIFWPLFIRKRTTDSAFRTSANSP